jgi:cytidyltransferase-like protein
MQINNKQKKETVVAVSGYFDPVHVGHIELFQKAKDLGDKLVVIVNNSHQAHLKKGHEFMPFKERVKIIQSIKYVDKVFESIDTDRTVCKSVEAVHPDILANGGDRNRGNLPEAETCDRLGIKMVDGLGEKIQSSSTLIEKKKST